MPKERILIEDEGFEVYVKTSELILMITVIEIVLGTCLYFAILEKEYIFIAAIGFFFVAIFGGIIPAINNIRNTNRNLKWAACSSGIKYPAFNTTLTKMKPPLIIPWADIEKIYLVDVLVDKSNRDGDGKTQRKNIAILKSGSTNKEFHYPKESTLEIFNTLKRLAPKNINVECLDRYEIG